MTPEGLVKKNVKELLKSYGEELDQFWPVQNGMGSPALDCIGCFKGLHFEIECGSNIKKKMTARQEQTTNKKRRAGAKVFFVNGVNDGMGLLRMWLDTVAQLDTPSYISVTKTNACS